MITKKYFSLCALFLTVMFGNAQNIGEPYKKSIDVIEGAIKLYDEGKYAESIEEYNKVNPSDSNYYYAVYETALAYTALKEYDKVVTACKKGLTLNSAEERGFYDLLGSAFDYKGQQDSALYYYNEGLKRFPHYHKFFYETAVSYMGKKNDSAAYRYLIMSARLNPIHAGTHLQMANLAARNGFYTSAALAYQFFFLLESQGDRAIGGLKQFEKLCNNNIELNEKIFDLSKNGENNFAEMDEIIKSRAAQIASYKTKVKLPFTDIIKQCQIISEKLKFDPNDKGFMNQFYVKLLSEEWKKGYFEAHMYCMFSDINSDKVQEQVKKNEKEISALKDFMYVVVNDYRTNIKHQLDGKEIEGRRFFYKKGAIQAVGVMNNEKKTGKWYIYDESGFISNIGTYVNDQPDGLWIAYYDSKIKSSEVNWTNGKRNGEYILYHPNGIIKEKGIYKNDLIDGEIISYSSNGAIRDKSMYKNGVLVADYILYDRQGIKSATASYENAKISGKVVNYYNNGVVSEEREYKNGSMNGPTKGYYNGGELNFTGTYKNDLKEGAWVFYHKNGKKSKEEFYSNNKANKTTTEYYENGTLKQFINYSNGLLDGEFKLYTKDGLLFAEGKYKNDKLQNSIYYDEDKKILAETKNTDNDYTLKKYYFTGNVDEEGPIKDRKRNGKFIGYYLNGAKATETSYKDDVYEGFYTKYHYNGKINQEYKYNNGELDGYYKHYYPNGTIMEDGYYSMGKRVGPYTEYYRNGKPKLKMYYSNDEAIGFTELYDIKGRIERKNHYNDIYTYKEELYDTLGNIFQTTDIKPGMCTAPKNYFNKAKADEYSYAYGKKHGKAKEYHPNGKIKSESNYFYGSFDGDVKVYDVSGNLVYTQFYKNGQQEGKEQWYDKSGKPDFVVPFYDGQVNGGKIWYFENGKIQSRRNFYDGKEDSITDYYGEDGTLALRSLFKEGVLVSYTYLDKTGKLLPPIKVTKETVNIVAYYPNGKKSREIAYVNGEVQGKRIQYFTNGTVYLDGTYVDDEMQGKVLEYYINGKVKNECNYLNDERNGVEKNYYETGVLESEITFVNGIKYGPEKLYDKTGKLIATYYNINGNSFVK